MRFKYIDQMGGLESVLIGGVDLDLGYLAFRAHQVDTVGKVVEWGLAKPAGGALMAFGALALVHSVEVAGHNIHDWWQRNHQSEPVQPPQQELS